jgi:hypothetical protein
MWSTLELNSLYQTRLIDLAVPAPLVACVCIRPGLSEYRMLIVVIFHARFVAYFQKT